MQQYIWLLENCSFFFFLLLPAAILRAAHHHRWRDHRHGSYTHCYRGGLSPAHVHHHRGGGRGRLQRNGVFGQWQQTADFTQRRCCLQRHRPVRAFQRFSSRQKLPRGPCSDRVNARQRECLWIDSLFFVVAGKQRGSRSERPGWAARPSDFILQFLQAETPETGHCSQCALRRCMKRTELPHIYCPSGLLASCSYVNCVQPSIENISVQKWTALKHKCLVVFQI